MQTGKYFGVLVTVQAYATNQKLLVNLTDHRTWDVGAFTGHPRPLTYGSCFLLPCTLMAKEDCRSQSYSHSHRELQLQMRDCFKVQFLYNYLQGICLLTLILYSGNYSASSTKQNHGTVAGKMRQPKNEKRRSHFP